MTDAQQMVIIATAAGTQMGYQTILKAIEMGATPEQITDFCKYAIEEALPNAMGKLPDKFQTELDNASTLQAEALINGKVRGGGVHVKTVSLEDDDKDEDLW